MTCDTICCDFAGTKHPCTLIYRAEHWIVPDFKPWGVISLAYLYQNRFSELFDRKPGQGLLLSLLATFLSPLVNLDNGLKGTVSFCVHSVTLTSKLAFYLSQL